MMISSGNNQFFYNGLFHEIDKIPYLPNTKVGYQIQTLDGEKYFITHTTSSYLVVVSTS